MRTRSVKLAVLSAVLAALTVYVDAFGDAGHRVIGRLAELHLRNSRALDEVRKILRPQETLADAAVWPDTIKNPLFEDDDTGPFRLQHPAHDTYHFANVPFQADRYDVSAPGARPTDIVQITRECIRVLRGAPGMFAPRDALRLLAHLVGDIHQPLHVGTGFVNAEGPLQFVVPKGSTGWRVTLGGNALLYGPQDRFNLHAYWDSHAVNLAMRQDDVPAYAARLFAELPVRAEWKNGGDADGWPAQWAGEALARAKEVHQGIVLTDYLGPDDVGRIAHRWRIQQPPNYDEMARGRLRLQLAAAGYRLGATLKAIWPDRR